MAHNKEKEQETDPKIDALLKQVLQDDLPPETEARMKDRLSRFRKNIEKSGGTLERRSKTFGQGFFQAGAWAWLRWTVRKETLAALSLIMIVAGGFLHISGQPSAMAATLSFMNSSLSIAGQIREAESMECRLQGTTEEGRRFAGTILWFSPEKTRAEIFEGEKAGKSLWREGPDIVIANLEDNSTRKYQSLEQIADPLFAPVMDFLSPESFSDALYRKWELRRDGRLDEGQDGTYLYLIEGGKTVLEMTIEANTNLPASIKKFSLPPEGAADARRLFLEARFIWNKTKEEDGHDDKER